MAKRNLTEGKGYRKIYYDERSACVSLAAENAWTAFDCELCGLNDGGEKMEPEVKKAAQNKGGGNSLNDGGEKMEPEGLTRKCKKCGAVKPIDEFKKHSRAPGGHVMTCNACHKQFRPRSEMEIKEPAPPAGEAVEKPTPAETMPEAWKDAGHNFDFELVGQILEEAGLLKRLVLEAENQFRLPEAQIAHYVREGLRIDQAAGCLDLED